MMFVPLAFASSRFSFLAGRARLLGWAAVTGLTLSASPAASAEEAPRQEVERLQLRVETLEQELASLRESLVELRQDHERRLETIESRVDRIAAPSAAPAAEPSGGVSEQERAEIERELEALLGETSETPSSATGGQAEASTERRFSSQTRTLNQLNPEISVTGDVFGTVSDRSGDPNGNQFRFSEFEVAFQGSLDPFSLAKAFVVQEEGRFEVEEAYIDWTTLPGGLGLKLGEFRQDFGKLNRWHHHALPQAQRPLVHQAFLGEEGLRGLGVGLSWLPNPFLGDYNEIWFQVTNDENDLAFSGRGFDDPVYLLHGTSYWDLTSASYLELGLSAANGVNDQAGRFRTQLYGVDWNYDWRPPARALYRGLELRGELLWQRRDSAQGTFDSLGAYTYGNYRLNRRVLVGLRADWTELPSARGEELWGVSPYVDWWQSEWVRVRVQYSHSTGILGGEEEESAFERKKDNRLFFQVTWALGPHKHEKY